MPRHDYNQVWFDDDDMPSEIDVFNDENLRRQKKEGDEAKKAPSVESEPTSIAGLGGRSAVSAMAAFQ